MLEDLVADEEVDRDQDDPNDAAEEQVDQADDDVPGKAGDRLRDRGVTSFDNLGEANATPTGLEVPQPCNDRNHRHHLD